MPLNNHFRFQMSIADVVRLRNESFYSSVPLADFNFRYIGFTMTSLFYIMTMPSSVHLSAKDFINNSTVSSYGETAFIYHSKAIYIFQKAFCELSKEQWDRLWIYWTAETFLPVGGGGGGGRKGGILAGQMLPKNEPFKVQKRPLERYCQGANNFIEGLEDQIWPDGPFKRGNIANACEKL